MKKIYSRYNQGAPCALVVTSQRERFLQKGQARLELRTAHLSERSSSDVEVNRAGRFRTEKKKNNSSGLPGSEEKGGGGTKDLKLDRFQPMKKKGRFPERGSALEKGRGDRQSIQVNRPGKNSGGRRSHMNRSKRFIERKGQRALDVVGKVRNSVVEGSLLVGRRGDNKK